MPDYGSFDGSPDSGSFGYGMEPGFNIRDLFRDYLSHEGLIGEDATEEDWAQFFDDYGSTIDDYEYDYTQDILEIKGMGENFDALRSTEESKLVSLTDRLGKLGMTGGGYQYHEDKKSIYDTWYDSIGESRAALKDSIGGRRDSWWSSQFFGGLVPTMNDLGYFTGSDQTYGDLFNTEGESGFISQEQINFNPGNCADGEYFDGTDCITIPGGGTDSPNLGGGDFGPDDCPEGYHWNEMMQQCVADPIPFN